MKTFLSKLLLGKIVYKVSTDASFEKVFEALQQAIKNNNFAIPTIHNLKETYLKSNLPLNSDFEYRIVQLCNAQKSHKAITTLSYDMGIMMPKSIVIARENGKTTLRFMKMKPWMVALMFPKIKIAKMSAKVMGTLQKIVEETVESAEK